MEKQMEIFFCHFTEDTQKAILRMFNIESPEEMNWDTIPMFILSSEDEDESM